MPFLGDASSFFLSRRRRGVVEVHREVLTFLTKSSSLGSPSLDAAELEDAVAHVGGELIAEGRRATPTMANSLGSRPILEVKERRQQLALGEVAGGAEDDDDGGFGMRSLAGGTLERSSGLCCHLCCGHALPLGAASRLLGTCWRLKCRISTTTEGGVKICWNPTSQNRWGTRRIGAPVFLVFLDGVAAEGVAHDGDHAVGEVVLFAGADAADERLGDDGRGDVEVDGFEDGPAAFAGVGT
jgi:hypothetical protein